MDEFTVQKGFQVKENLEQPAMKQDNYCLPDDYVSNPAVTFDQGEKIYWDTKRLATSLAYQHSVYEWACRLITRHDVKRTADVGCGGAAKLTALHDKFPHLEIWGFDQPNAIRLCKKRYGFGHWVPIDFESPGSLPKVKFDLVISSDVIEHLQNPDILLRFIESVLAPGGLVLLSTPARDLLRGQNCRRSPNPYHVREWTQEEFSAYLSGRGFNVLEHRCLPAYKISRNLLFLKKALQRWACGKTINYNQAVLLRRSENF